jgi:hypothetical protein
LSLSPEEVDFDENLLSILLSVFGASLTQLDTVIGRLLHSYNRIKIADRVVSQQFLNTTE